MIRMIVTRTMGKYGRIHRKARRGSPHGTECNTAIYPEEIAGQVLFRVDVDCPDECF